MRRIAATKTILTAAIILIAPTFSTLATLKLVDNIIAQESWDINSFSLRQAYGDTPSEGEFHFFITGIDKTGLHKFSGEAEGITYFDSFVDTAGNPRINNTLTESGLDAKILNPDTTLDYCCWNSTATVTENLNGTYTFTLYAYGDFTDLFPQFSAVYLTALIGSDKSTITNVNGITALETGDGSEPLLTCDLRTEQNCYPENHNVGSQDHSWQMRFTSDDTAESYVTGAFIDTQDERGAFEFIHKGKAKVVHKNNPFFAAGRYTVTTEIRFDYERDVKGNVDLLPSGVIILNKGKPNEQAYQLEWTSFYTTKSNKLIYSAMFYDELTSENNLLGEVYGKVNLKGGIDYENKVDMKSKRGNTLYVSILTDGIPEPSATVVFDTKKTSKATLEFVD
jgi:hypothetical protein